jgi:superfamily II DNA helicase RecQ
MGVDKKNIRTVIHMEPPLTVEAYLQESGRAGRDREQANPGIPQQLSNKSPEAEAIAAASNITATNPEEIIALNDDDFDRF